MKIVIIDYGIGNVKSIINAFENQGQKIILSRERDIILGSDGIILPGVGAFSHAMHNLNKYGLVSIIKDYAKTGKPLLGICLGMQMLFDESEEFGITKGLGLIKGKVIKLPVKHSNEIKLPHISWSGIFQNKTNWGNTIFNNITNGCDMYFVHTFVAKPDNDNEILSISQYFNVEFCSSVKNGNIYGCQFHPEKSAENGLRVIENFINVCKKN